MPDFQRLSNMILCPSLAKYHGPAGLVISHLLTAIKALSWSSVKWYLLVNSSHLRVMHSGGKPP